MKKILSSMLVIAVWMILPMTLWANQFTQYEVSNDTDTKVDYYVLGKSNYPVEPTSGLPTGWNGNPGFDETRWSLASQFLSPPLEYLIPTDPTSPLI